MPSEVAESCQLEAFVGSYQLEAFVGQTVACLEVDKLDPESSWPYQTVAAVEIQALMVVVAGTLASAAVEIQAYQIVVVEDSLALNFVVVGSLALVVVGKKAYQTAVVEDNLASVVVSQILGSAGTLACLDLGSLDSVESIN